ncbi:hypothetical protein [Echinimonas agarilytica]|uniref:Uncharacterized protein n=1 Tax=Echinimonas agarilytica TaxID=1215918 RepID=A0AA41W6C4_9GAMM|nr:hypothetical protein [Echinimonas agarilytica]MCM2679379.1 hypothetical protein [Echinimonas agarilytica]
MKMELKIEECKLAQPVLGAFTAPYFMRPHRSPTRTKAPSPSNAMQTLKVWSQSVLMTKKPGIAGSKELFLKSRCFVTHESDMNCSTSLK